MVVHPLDNGSIKLLHSKLGLDNNAPHEVLTGQEILEGLLLEVSMLLLPLLGVVLARQVRIDDSKVDGLLKTREGK